MDHVIVPADRPHLSGARLRGGPLAFARAAWLVVAVLALCLFATGIPAQFAQLQVACPTAVCVSGQLPPAGLRALDDLGLSRQVFAAYTVAMDVFFAAVCGVVAVLIFWRRSDERMALFASLALLTFGTATFTLTLGALAARHPAAALSVSVIHYLGAASFGLFLYVFPDGRFVPRWTAAVALVWLGWQLIEQFIPHLTADPPPWYLLIETVVWLAALPTAIFSQVYRYGHVADTVQRRQIKWVVLGISAALAIFLGISTAVDIVAFPSPASTGGLVAYLVGYMFIGYLGVLLIPLSIGIAVLRHHLFDVDIVINRALVYGALTAAVAGFYVLLVGSLGTLFQARGNLLISLVATGLVAVIVQPLRARLQRGVNRLMYGERDDPYAVLSRLGQRMEVALAPDAVLPAIVETVAQALKLPYAAIMLAPRDEPIPAGQTAQTGSFVAGAATGSPVANPLRLPLVHQGETVGQLVLAPRGPREGFSTSDRRLLQDLTHQIGVAVHAARLTSDLQRSRERLVLAREEERRRLRRDLHDGLGPTLAALALTAGNVHDIIPSDPLTARSLAAELQREIRTTIADIRRLVYELRPPALDELGLAGAIRDRAVQFSRDNQPATAPDADAGLRVIVEMPEWLPPLPAAVEVAAFRITQEALTNVRQHSRARNCTIRLSLGDALHLEIVDDGTGLPQQRRAGVGLLSMRERAAELGGSCVIESVNGAGTRVSVRLPLP